jgi:DNA-binding transcriptional MerR regulator
MLPATRHTRKGLYKISDVSRETGVPVGTIKFYIRAGLLPGPTIKTGRNMAYYDRKFIDRTRCIRELQQKRFLPLGVIKAIMDGDTAVISPREVATLLSLEGRFYEALRYGPDPLPVPRADVANRFGLNDETVKLCIDLGLLSPQMRGQTEQFEGDDILVLETMAAMRQAGIDDDLIPARTALPVYVEALDSLARQELRLFTRGVSTNCDEARTAELALAGMRLAEQFILLVRRKRLLQALNELRAEAWRASTASTGTDD